MFFVIAIANVPMFTFSPNGNNLVQFEWPYRPTWGTIEWLRLCVPISGPNETFVSHALWSVFFIKGGRNGEA